MICRTHQRRDTEPASTYVRARVFVCDCGAVCPHAHTRGTNLKGVFGVRGSALPVACGVVDGCHQRKRQWLIEPFIPGRLITHPQEHKRALCYLAIKPESLLLLLILLQLVLQLHHRRPVVSFHAVFCRFKALCHIHVRYVYATKETPCAYTCTPTIGTAG